MIDEGGAIPVELAAAVGLLLLPVFVFVMTIAPVVERRTVAGQTAAEAARAFVVAADTAAGLAAAGRVIERANAGHPFDLTLSVDGDMQRGEVVTATVEVRMPVVIFPGVLSLEIATYSAHHSEQVDPLRSVP